MITKSLGRTIQAVMCVALLIAAIAEAMADPGEITAVQVASDLKSIVVRSDGPLGKHTAFVIDRPFRLVIDFEATSLGKLQGKIRVDREPISEIRLGYHNDRARVVVDFGDHPVPPFQIERDNNLFMVVLGKSPALPGKNSSKGSPVPKPPPLRSEAQPPVKTSLPSEMSTPERPIPKSEVPRPEKPPVRSEAPLPERIPRDPESSAVSVKTAYMKNNLLIVELVDPKDPKLTYRMVVDLDVDELSIKGALLSDAKGNLKKFEFFKSEPESRGSSGSESKITVGPRKSSPTGAADIDEGTYRRGMPTARTGKPPETASGGTWPLRIEEFRPQSRRAER